MRTRLGALGAAVVAALALLTAGSVAGAQTQTFSCSFAIDTTALPAPGGPVEVRGTAPPNSTVRIFVDSVLRTTVTSAPGTGAFVATIVITATSEVTVGVDGYPTTPCIGVGGVNLARPTVSATGLALTGASGTRQAVLVGVAVLSVGLVLVVATRRRSNVLGRA
jgi:hypothetical protein